MSNEVSITEEPKLSHEDLWEFLEREVRGNAVMPEDSSMASVVKALAWKVMLLEKEVKGRTYSIMRNFRN